MDIIIHNLSIDIIYTRTIFLWNEISGKKNFRENFDTNSSLHLKISFHAA